MYVKKSFQITDYHKKQSQQQVEQIIVDIIKNEYKPVSISYITIKANVQILMVYKIINRLLCDNILEMVQVSICPICETENLLDKEDEKVKCSFCKEHYSPYYIEEKFRLKD